MRLLIPVCLALISHVSHAETIVCAKDLTLSTAAGIRAGGNIKDYYRYGPGRLREVWDDRTLADYTIVSEKDGLIVGALRQQGYPSDTQVVVIDRKNKRLTKTVIQGDLRFTSFGPCSFSP